MRKVETPTKLIGSFNDIIRDRRFFGDADLAAQSVWGTEETRLFENGEGSIVSNLTTGAPCRLRKCDTSLFNNGIIPNSQNFVVMAIGIDIHLSNVRAQVPYTDNTIQTIDVSPAQVNNPYPLLDAIRSFGTFDLYKNATDFMEGGNVSDYPCGLYVSGSGSDGSSVVPATADGGEQDTYNVNGFVVLQNGMAFRPLTVWHVLEELDQFYGRFVMQYPLNLTGTGLTGYIDFLLIGQANVDDQGIQMITNFTGQTSI